MNAQLIDKAERFRALHFIGKPLLLPNVWDGMSAAACVAAGFEAIATTSCGIAWSLGYQDGERMSRTEMMAAIKRIARVAGDVPVSADIETGYACNDAELAETVAAVIDAGAIGINLEDSLPGNHECLRSMEEAAHRIDVVRRAGKEVPLFINARVDVYFTPDNDKAARDEAVLARCKA
jgi:2-methylisocitrate lyase-like PEP mutase family enzyme